MTQFKELAINPHVHSIFSHDGVLSIEEHVKTEKDFGRKAVTLTEHGNMNSAFDLYIYAKKHDMKLIHGIELYIRNPFNPIKISDKGKESVNLNHLTVFFKTQNAYSYFCQMSSKWEKNAVVVWGHRKPVATFDDLFPISNEIVVLTGCPASILNTYDIKAYEFLKQHFPNLYIEIQPVIITSGYDFQQKKIIQYIDDNGNLIDKNKKFNKFLIELSKTFNDKIIISLDNHMVKQGDKILQDIKLANGKQDAFAFSEAFYSKNITEIINTFQNQLSDITHDEYSQWIDNSYDFVEHFNDYKFYTAKDQIIFPTIDIIFGDKYAGKSNLAIMVELVKSYGRMPTKDHEQYHIYMDRLKYELSVLSENGTFDLLPYFFTIYDVANSLREKYGDLCSSRGSASGCLLTYLLGISIADPIKYGLFFDRFISLGRIKSGSLPDIDLDLSMKENVLNYLKDKYGEYQSAISINVLMKLKSAIKDTERVFFNGEVRQETEIMVRKLPNITTNDEKKWLFGYYDNENGIEVKGFLEENTEISKQLKKYSEDNPQIWETVLKLLGLVRQKSSHAAGVVIADKPINHYIPQIQVADKLITGFCPKGVEGIGLVKFDMLGVSTLNSIKYTLQSIEKYEGIKLEWEEFPHDDNVYQNIIHNIDKLAGIFQISTHLMKSYVKRIKPNNIEQLSNLIALVRPGTLDAPLKLKDGTEMTAAEFYVQCANGKREPEYIHDDLIPILSSTYGIVLYQESTLRVFRELGGYSYEQAENVRRAIGKKIKDVLEKELNNLQNILLHKGWKTIQTEQLKDVLIASGKYSFNKSHACFPEYQKIQTKNGQKTIAELLKIKEEIASYNQETGNIEYIEFSNLWYNGNKEVYEFELEDGSLIKATQDHMVFTTIGWKSLLECYQQGLDILCLNL